MAIPPRFVLPGAALALAALVAAGWLAWGPGRDTAPAPVTADGERGDAVAPDATAHDLPEAVEGEEAGLSDDQAATAPVIIETDEGPMPSDGEAGLGTDAGIDESPLTESTDVDLTLPPGDPITLPSGRQVWWADSAQDTQGPAGLTYRFRFVAPHLSPTMDAEQQKAAHDDMQTLCDSFALPRLARPGPVPQQIVITLMDRLLAFGEADTAVTQFFEAFSLTSPQGGDPSAPSTPLACQWEVY